MEDAELMRIRNELEVEKLKQKQWEVAKGQLCKTREHAEQEHTRILAELEGRVQAANKEASAQVLDWFSSQLPSSNPVVFDPEEEVKQKQLEALIEQQAQISNKIAKIEGTASTSKPETRNSQEVLLHQLRGALAGKQEDDDRTLLKALLTSQNKAPGEGGTNTLKPSILNNITSQGGGNNMAEWLASLNKHKEGESEFTKLLAMGESEVRAGKARSGILDRATTNIQQKQV